VCNETAMDRVWNWDETKILALDKVGRGSVHLSNILAAKLQS